MCLCVYRQYRYYCNVRKSRKLGWKNAQLNSRPNSVTTVIITTLNTTINNRTITSTVMKGNQGLEALANLCNNASKTEDAISNERDTQQSQRSAAIAGPTQEFNSAMNNYTSNAAQQSHQNQSINGLPQNLAAIIKSMGPQMNQQQATNVMANAGLGVNNDTMSALHQLAYLNPLGSTASSVLQLMNQANTTTQNNFPYTGMDTTPLSSLFGASQAQGTGKAPSSSIHINFQKS